jgi:NAD(P)-dependent dehydrogenase (short-subunit alcohol dehydrogenase family)
MRVNAISPGYTATPMNTRPEVAEQRKQFEAAVFLVSGAASFVTGIDLLVDGGFVCW